MLKKIIIINVEMTLLTGMYIGGTDNGFDIGGADSTVIRNPLDNKPYIPGSSLKGKLKYLLKITQGVLNEESSDYDFKDNNIAIIFGSKDPIEGKINQQARGIFRDLTLVNEEELEEKLGKGRYTEIKGENSIDSLKSKANPRFIERVPAGAQFAGEIDLNVFDEDDEEKMVKALKDALDLLKYNYIGGNGTRGYGRVDVKVGTEEKAIG